MAYALCAACLVLYFRLVPHCLIGVVGWWWPPLSTLATGITEPLGYWPRAADLRIYGISVDKRKDSNAAARQRHLFFCPSSSCFFFFCSGSSLSLVSGDEGRGRPRTEADGPVPAELRQQRAQGRHRELPEKNYCLQWCAYFASVAGMVCMHT